MHLKGWCAPLCDEAVQALANGTLVVYFDEKLKCELLKGYFIRHGIRRDFL